MSSKTLQPLVYNDMFDQQLKKTTKAPVPSKEASDKFILCRDNRCDSKPGSLSPNCRDVDWTQLIPVRYAITEHYPQYKYLMSRDYEPVTGRFRPVGLRLFDHGYLYYVHSKYPNELHEFEMKMTESGFEMRRRYGKGPIGKGYSRRIDVPNCGLLYVLYSDHRLSEHLRELFVKDTEYRLKVCQVVNMDSKKDLLRIDANEVWNEIAECRTTPREPGLFTRLHTYSDPEERITAMPGEEEEPPYFWDDKFTPCEFKSLTDQILEKYRPESYFLMVDDPVGIMDDMSKANTTVLKRSEKFMEQHGEKMDAARFLTGLIEVTPEHIRNAAKELQAEKNPGGKPAAKLPDPIAHIPDAKLQELIDQHDNLAEQVSGFMGAELKYLDTLNCLFFPGRPMNDHYVAQKWRYDRELKKLKLEDAFARVYTGRDAIAYGTAECEQGLKELVNYQDARDWLRKHDEEYAIIQEELDALDLGRACILERCHNKLFGYDYTDDGVNNFLNLKMTSWLTGLTASGNKKSIELTRRFFLEKLGVQNIGLFLNTYLYKDKDLKQENDYVAELIQKLFSDSADALAGVKSAELDKEIAKLEEQKAEQKRQREQAEREQKALEKKLDEEERKKFALEEEKKTREFEQKRIEEQREKARQEEKAVWETEQKRLQFRIDAINRELADNDSKITHLQTDISKERAKVTATEQQTARLEEQSTRNRARRAGIASELSALPMRRLNRNYVRTYSILFALVTESMQEFFINGQELLRSSTGVTRRVFNLPELAGLRAILCFDAADQLRNGYVTAGNLLELNELQREARTILAELNNNQRTVGRRRWFRTITNPDKYPEFNRYLRANADSSAFLNRLRRQGEGAQPGPRIGFSGRNVEFRNVDNLEAALTELSRLIDEAERTVEAKDRLKTELRQIKNELRDLQGQLPELRADAEKGRAAIRTLEGQLNDLIEANSKHKADLLAVEGNLEADLPERLRERIAPELTPETTSAIAEAISQGADENAARGSGQHTARGGAAVGSVAAAEASSAAMIEAAAKIKPDYRAGFRGVRAMGALTLLCAFATYKSYKDYKNSIGTEHENKAMMDFGSLLFQTLSAGTASASAFVAATLRHDVAAITNSLSIQSIARVEKLFTRITAGFMLASMFLDVGGHIHRAVTGNAGKGAAIGSTLFSAIGGGVTIRGIYLTIVGNNFQKFILNLVLGPSYANIVLFVGFIVIRGATAILNYFERTALQSWAENCVWGLKNKGWDQERQSVELAKAIYIPVVNAKEIWNPDVGMIPVKTLVPSGRDHPLMVERTIPVYPLRGLMALEYSVTLPDLWPGNEPDIGKMRVTGAYRKIRESAAYDLSPYTEVELHRDQPGCLTLFMYVDLAAFFKQKGEPRITHVDLDLHPLAERLGENIFPAGLYYRRTVQLSPEERTTWNVTVDSIKKKPETIDSTGRLVNLRFGSEARA